MGKLREARELLASCTKSACGELISQQCRFAVQQLDSDMPSVVPVVTDAAGTPIVEVEVRIDGQLLTSRLDGVSLEVDPGLHEFSFQTSQGVVHTQRLMIVTGQRNRLVPVQLGSAQARPMPPTAAAVAAAPLGAGTATPETPNAASEEAPLTMQASTSQSTPIDGAGPKHSVIPYVLGGVGVAAVGTSLLLANWGSKDNELLDRCAPNCEPSSVDHVKALYLAADISLGVGIVAIAGATWVFVSELNEGRPVAPQATAAYHLDVRPVASGAVAQLGGTF